MNRVLSTFILVLAMVAPAAAQTTGGMSAMGYYVGTWTCVGGPVGSPPATATLTAVMNGDLLNTSVAVPAQTGMKTPYYSTFVISYDGKGHYLQTTMDNMGSWGVSTAPTPTGNTEQWTDVTTSDNKPGHGTLVRTDNTHYSYTGYATPTGTTPNFQIACQRQST